MTTPRACSPGTCSVTPYHGLEVYYIKSLGCPVILFLKKEWHNQGNICQSIEWELILDVFWTKYFYWNERVDTGPHTKIMGSAETDGHDSDHSRVTSMNSGLISRHVFSWVWSWKESPMRWKYSHENTNLASEWTGDALWSLDVGLKEYQPAPTGHFKMTHPRSNEPWGNAERTLPTCVRDFRSNEPD